MTQGARIAFADESGTGPEFACYAIGVLSFAAERLEHFTRVFGELRQRHGVVGEFKWSKLSNSHGPINMTLDWMDRILRSRTASYDVIVVHKAQYQRWAARGANRESAFYLTYTYLLRHIARRSRGITQVYIDDRSDAYALQHEVVETVGNRMLAQLQSTGRLGSVTRAPSSESPGIQVADVLTGAFEAAHQRHLVSSTQLNAGKRLAIARLARLLGWDDLKYDTYPHPKLNVWHFPQEFRATPQTRSLDLVRPVPYVTKEDLDAARSAR